MLRKIETLPRLWLTLFVVAAAIGCDSDQVRKTDDQIVGGVRPTFLFLEVTANKSSITAGAETNPIKITVRALFADTGQPVADGTEVSLTTTLGGFDAVGGAAGISVTLQNGVGEASFFPGDTAGTARIRASLQGVIDQISIIIKPFVEPIPPPTAASLSLATDTTVVSEESSPTIIVTATVVGSNAEPFENAPVQFSSPLGVFLSSGASASDILATDANGEISDDLDITQAELEAFPTDSFEITGTLFMEGGAQASTTVTITIVRADAPPTPTSIVLSANPSTINDDGSEQNVTLSAVVRDQNGLVMAGVSVDFSTELGSVLPVTDDTDGSGVATTTLTVPAGTVAGYAFDSFDAQASMGVQGGGTATDTVTIGIIRPAPPSVTAEFTWDTDATDPDEDPEPCSDDSLGVSIVQFEDLSTGPVTTWEWDLDGDGFFDDAFTPSPMFDYDSFAIGVAVNVTLRVTDGGASSDTVVHPITPRDCS